MSQSNKLYFEITGLTIKLVTEIPLEKINLSERILSFCVSDKNQEADVTLYIKDQFELPSTLGDLIYDPGDIWKMYRNGNIFNAVVSYDSKEPMGIVSTAGDWKNITVYLNRSNNKQSGLLNTAGFELIIRAAIQFNRGSIFHSSGLDDNGKGILFVGHAGEGKSTQSRLWMSFEGTMIFNEDRNAVRIIDDDVFCYGTPWGGTANIAKNHKVPLSVILMIEKSEENRIERMPVSEAVPKLIARSFFPYWDENLSNLAISNITSIAAKVPVYKLSCKPTPEVVELVRSVL
ncbi:MAG: hypothetical protein WC644_07980 [Ignavibacteria bacterium]